ncbi:hypothetical protein L3X38_002116 [Prunus dulcis]|uniref:Peptidyl-prolyl cis-trans isomerase n=1 Tax=Prunus dulcis TaxID=3755 RepID=A0AAD4WTD3_PRUDU|nr:hypothetical protein L3X38_002116 [Prunus dulcis]
MTYPVQVGKLTGLKDRAKTRDRVPQTERQAPKNQHANPITTVHHVIWAEELELCSPANNLTRFRAQSPKLKSKVMALATYRYWSRRSLDQSGSDLSTLEDIGGLVKKYDLPGYAVLSQWNFFKDGSPEVVDRFLDLCQKGHFQGMPFSHVIKHYVIKGGGSQGLGAAEDWISKGKLRSQLVMRPKHEAFMLGTTKNRLDDKGFELVITTAPIPDLNDKLIVFGRVIKGEDVVQEIEEGRYR